MADWFEYAVTTRTGPGVIERPDGETWEIVEATSTFIPAGATPGRPGVAEPARVEHHAFWKRRKPAALLPRAPSGTAGAVGAPGAPGAPTVAPGAPRRT